MERIAMMALVALMISVGCYAENYTTAGNGTTWTLTKLAETEGSGVTKEGTTFTLANKVVVAKGDNFELEAGIQVLMAKDVDLLIEGTAKLDVPDDKRVLFTHTAEDVKSGMLNINRDDAVTKVKNIDFEYVGLKSFGEKGLEVDSCTFRNHVYTSNNGSCALSMGGNGAEFVVRSCIFEKNERSAIGGSANSANPVLIENCQFLDNGTHNRNYPQVNLTAASQVTIRGCVVIGNRDKMRVGGIIVSNLVGAAQNAHLLIENCFVKDAAYGISVYSDQTAIVRNNVLINNDRVAAASQGGSGLNVTDSSGKQETKFTGNVVIGSFWGASIIGGKNINFGRIDVPETDENYNPGQNVFYDNGNGEPYVAYDLYNNSAKTIYAQNNFWLTAASFKAEGIDKVINDKKDNDSLGEVIYQLPNATLEPSSIAAIQRALSNVQAVYNLSGMQTNDLKQGLNIVVKDGKAIKVMK